MDEIKIDLQNKFAMDKYYAELEIIRLSKLDYLSISQKLRIELLTEQIDILDQANRRLDLLDVIYPPITQENEERSAE